MYLNFTYFYFTVPETPPTQVTCDPLSSQSVRVFWNAPPPHQHGGIIQGYKVYYRPVPTDNSKLFAIQMNNRSICIYIRILSYIDFNYI